MCDENRKEALEAVETFAAANGRQWRSKLRNLWYSGRDTGPLRLARNVFGPSGIDRIKVN